MSEVIKFYNFDDAIEYSIKFKKDPKNFGQKLSIEILGEFSSIKKCDFSHIDDLLINFPRNPEELLELEDLFFVKITIIIPYKCSKIKLKNCRSTNNFAKFSIKILNNDFKDHFIKILNNDFKDHLNIEVDNVKLSIKTIAPSSGQYQVVKIPIKLNILGNNVDLFDSSFRNLDIIFHKDLSNVEANFYSCNFSGFLKVDSLKNSKSTINFVDCKSESRESKIEVKDCNVEIINSNFLNIDFCLDAIRQFLLRINCSTIDTLEVGKNQSTEIISTLPTFKFIISEIKKSLKLNQGAKALDFKNCKINGFLINGEITEKAIFNNVTFTNPPNIGDIKFKNCNVEFRDPDFKDKKTPEAIAGFRALNKACRDANYHHGEIFFHGLTLEGRGEELKYESDFVEKLLSDAYEVFSDFGRSVNRPLLWLLILGFIFFGINYYEINKINNLKLSENSVINKSIVENNNNFEEEQNQLNKINKKIVIRNAIGPLRIALPKDFIEDNEEKLFKEKINSDFIYFLNIIHAFLSLGIWSIWLFMIRARFKL